MHQAPAVRVAVGRSRWHLGCIVGGVALAVVSLMAFVWNNAQADWRVWAIFLVMLLATLFALQGWWRSPVGQLAWDGQHWLWSDAATGVRECRLTLCLDGLRFALVRLEADNAQPLWLWLQPGSRADTTWLPLRRAIVSNLVGGGQATDPVRPGVGEPVA